MVPSGYYAVLRPDRDGNILVHFPQHANINTFGRDWEEAQEMAREALSVGLEADFEKGYKLSPAQKPRARKGDRVVLVHLDPEVRTAYISKALKRELIIQLR